MNEQRRIGCFKIENLKKPKNNLIFRKNDMSRCNKAQRAGEESAFWEDIRLLAMKKSNQYKDLYGENPQFGSKKHQSPACRIKTDA